MLLNKLKPIKIKKINKLYVPLVLYQPIVELKKFNKNKRYEKFEALTYLKKIDLENDTTEDLNYPKIQQIFFNKQKFFSHLCFITFQKIKKDIKKHNINVSFNITIEDIKNPLLKNEFIHSTNEITNDNKKLGNFLTFEFVEEMELTKEPDIVSTFMKDIKQKSPNTKFALDDFGKGYATFDPLLSFEFDIIKLDGIITKNFLNKPKNYYLLNLLVDMSKRINIDIVSEYIDNDEEFAALAFIECKYAQGFFFAKPSPLNNFL